MKNIRSFAPVFLGLALCLYVVGCGSNATGGGGSSGGTSVIYVSTTGDDTTGEGTSAKPYKTIGHALTKVPSSGIISVEAGTYTENLTWPNKNNITLKGASRETTVIDGNYTGRCILIDTSLTITSARIENITAQKGVATSGYGGAGINMARANCTLDLKDVIVRYCSLEAPSGANNGAGVSVSDSTGTLVAINCKVTENHAHYAADLTRNSVGGVYCSGNALLSSCEVYNNYSDGVAGGVDVSNGRLENCLIYGNTAGDKGGGMAFYESDTVEVVNCTIISNESTSDGGGLYSYACQAKIYNCIFWNNNATTGSDEVYARPAALPGTFSIKYCDVKGGTYAGTGNITDEPQFTSLTNLVPNNITVYNGGTNEAWLPTSDYNGAARTSPYSIGAYEKN